MLGGATVLAVTLALVVVLGTHHAAAPASAASNQLAAAGASQAQAGEAASSNTPQASATPVQRVADAGASDATQPAPTNQLAVADAPTPSAGQNAGQQGVKVHGWWTVTVKNPDGTVADQRQFENSLTSDGATLLTDILMGTSTPGAWTVELSGNACSGSSHCYILDDRSQEDVSSFASYFKTLSVAASSTTHGDVLVLSGYATASQDGSVTAVSTALYACSGDDAASACVASGLPSREVTEASLSSPISVIQNQQIAVKVVISFS